MKTSSRDRQMRVVSAGVVLARGRSPWAPDDRATTRRGRRPSRSTGVRPRQHRPQPLSLVLEPGYQLVFEGTDDGEKVGLVITVLDETQRRSTASRPGSSRSGRRRAASSSRSRGTSSPSASGRTASTTSARRWTSTRTARSSSHEGAWLSGVGGAKFGLAMPGDCRCWVRATTRRSPPAEAMDRAEVVSLSETVKTPAGTFENCLKTEETTPLEPDCPGFAKVYAPGVGLLADGPAKLVRHGKAA